MKEDEDSGPDRREFLTTTLAAAIASNLSTGTAEAVQAGEGIGVTLLIVYGLAMALHEQTAIDPRSL